MRYDCSALIQRWLCRNCGYRFSQLSLTNKKENRHTLGYQVCANVKEAKNLVEVETRTQKWAARATELDKDVIPRQKWSGNRRKNVINAYTLFLKTHGSLWEKPKCAIEQKIPFIPAEQEINALIAGAGKKLAAFLQLLKETAMRAGEAVRLE